MGGARFAEDCSADQYTICALRQVLQVAHLGMQPSKRDLRSADAFLVCKLFQFCHQIYVLLEVLIIEPGYVSAAKTLQNRCEAKSFKQPEELWVEEPASFGCDCLG